MIGRRHKRIAEEIADASWEVAKGPFGAKEDPHRRYERAKVFAESMLFERRREIAGKRKFGSVVGTIVFSLVMNLVLKILMKKLEDVIFSEGQSGEGQ